MAQLKSTNVMGNLSVTGNILASKIIKIGGTSNQILMANGETTNLSDILGKLNAAVILKGTLGTDGTIQSLPAADITVLGHAYKVVTKGTYNSIAAKVGDMFICYESSANTYAWMLIPSGDDIENTWRPIKLEGTQILTNGTSSKPLNFKQGANITITHSDGDLTITAADSTYGADRGISLVSDKFGHSNTAITAQATKGLYKISYDAYGHITGAESYTDQNTTYSFTGGTDGFIVTPSGGSAQTVSVTPRRIASPDTRNTTIGPDGIAAGIQFDFKTSTTVGHPTTAGGKYVGVMTWKSYGDATDYSGGGPLQLSYDEAGVLWTRIGSRAAWGDWHQLATIEDVTSISGAYLPLAGGTMNENAVITLPNTARIVYRTKTSSNYVAEAVWYKGTSATSSGYDAQIGWHNTGDTDGAITILPYATTSEPWSSNVGLYISKTRLRYNGTNISLEGHGHTDMVTGSGLTATKVVVGDGGSKVKISDVTIDASNNLSVPGKLTVSAGAYISGRAADGGDDEGLIIGRASNGYAGLILGGATGRRSVFYLMPDTYTALPTKAVWRYNDGTNQSEIAHPGKSGTIALLSDLGSGGDYDVSQVTVTTEDAKATRYLTFVDAHETKKQSLKVDDDIYYASDNNYNWSSLNIGKSTKNGILTLHRYTGTSDRYVNLQVQNAISTNYTVYMPPAAGTLATQEWVDDNVNSANNSKITISTSGKGLSGSDYFNLNQDSNKTITITLDSSTAGNRTAEKVVIAKADGQINSMKYAITNDGDVVKASWQYNALTECIELMWA